MPDVCQKVAQPPLPRLALAITHHDATLVSQLVNRPLPVTFRRSYNRKSGSVTLVLACASGSPKALRQATKAAMDLLIHLGFITHFHRSGVLTVTGYYGDPIPAVAAETNLPAAVNLPALTRSRVA